MRSKKTAVRRTAPNKTTANQTRINPYHLFIGAMIPNWLMCRKEVSHGAKITYARLVQYSGKNGVAWPDQKTIAVEMGVEERQARRYIAELEHHGLIEVQQIGLGTTNRYYFLRHTWMEAPEVVDMPPPEPLDKSGQPEDRSDPSDRSDLSSRQVRSDRSERTNLSGPLKEENHVKRIIGRESHTQIPHDAPVGVGVKTNYSSPKSNSGSVSNSTHSIEECRKFADALTKDGINNPGGFARSIWRSGEADGQITVFLKAEKEAEAKRKEERARAEAARRAEFKAEAEIILANGGPQTAWERTVLTLAGIS